MRIQNSLKNMLFGVTGQMISAVMGFVVRTVFIYTLGVEYLGVEGLFSGILLMLSLANLGFDTAVTYSLYKPLADQNIYKIQAIMNLYKKAYRLIGLIVLVIGLALLPFLPYFMNGETTIKHINIIYLLFLMNSVSSYYFVYKQSIVIADQRNHVISKVHSVFTIVSNLMQVILLISARNYVVVLIVQLAFRVVENMYISRKADILYSYINLNKDAVLSQADKKLFFENLYSLLLYKISGVVINGTDNIVIAKYIGVYWMGIYSNYLLIINTLNTFLSYIFYSITASVGNLTVKENEEKKYFIFRVLSFASFWIYGFCAISLWSLMNPLISIWLGSTFVFDKFVLLTIIINFITTGMQNAPTTFRDTTGLFKTGKYRPLIAAVTNIVVSIVLAQKIGVAGVLLGTVISRLGTYFWYDPYVIYRFVFDKPVITYFIRYASFLVVVVITALLTDMLGSMFDSHPIVNIILRAVLCLCIPNTIFFVIYRRSEEFKYLSNVMKTLIGKFYSKRLVKVSMSSKL